jgi:hypothetical protein
MLTASPARDPRGSTAGPWPSCSDTPVHLDVLPILAGSGMVCDSRQQAQGWEVRRRNTQRDQDTGERVLSPPYQLYHV